MDSPREGGVASNQTCLTAIGSSCRLFLEAWTKYMGHGDAMSLLTRFFNVLRSRVLEHECDDELRFHVDERAAGYIRQGMTKEDAYIAARAKLGDVNGIKSAMLEVRMMNQSFLAGVLTGTLVTVAVGAIIVPASVARMNRTSSAQVIQVSGDDAGSRNYYTSPLVTMRCADGRLHHTVVMSRREPPTATIAPPAGCEVVSVRRP